MKTLILSVKDRILIPSIFSANKDSLTEAAVQRSIIKAVAIGEQEVKDINFRPAQGGYLWDARLGLDKEFSFESAQVNYLKESIYTISKAGGISQDLLPICENINDM